MRRAVAVVAFLLLIAIALLWRRHLSTAHPTTSTTADLGARKSVERAHPAPPLRLPTATAREDVKATAGEFGGRVISTADGKPVAHASLTFLHEGAALSVDANEAGHFVVRATSAGAYELTSASARGFASFAPELGHSPVVVHPHAGVRLEDITIFLVPEVELVVIVTDDRGKPIAGAEVRAFDDERGPAEAKVATTDGKGQASVRAVEGQLVEARHAGYTSARAYVNFAAVANGQLRLHLTAGVERARMSIGGHVVDGRGQPVDGALVEAFAPPGADLEAPMGAQTLSGVDGRFALAGLDDATYSLRATTRASGGVIVRGVRAGTADVELRLGAVTAILHGTVSDGAGKPVTAFTIVAWPKEGVFGRGPEERATVIDPDGRYSLPLPAGTYAVSAAARGFARAADRNVEVGDSGAEANFTLARGSRIFGRVVERVGGAPIAGAHVGFEGHAIDDAVGISTDATSDSDGNFALDGLPAGRQSLNVQAAEHNGRILSALDVPTDGALGPLTIDLARTAPGEEPSTEFVGIAATIGARPEGMLVMNVQPGGGASDAGLVAGDMILSIDGQSAEALGFIGSIQLIRGPEGTVVTLVVQRKDGSVQTIPVQRKRVNY
ncbi:MAG TPA: carboxypeptidase regulatory-like domain-containing protein [Polyangia bacterium]|jgi:hypothetical protein